jgi:uroporphyrinogen-III synthase
LGKTKLASIGPVTTATLRGLDLKPTLQANIYSIDGLVDVLCGAVERIRLAQPARESTGAQSV